MVAVSRRFSPIGFAYASVFALISALSAGASGQTSAQDLETAKNLPFPISNGFSRGLQKVTGITAVTQIVVGQVAQRALKRRFGGQVKVKIRTWSLSDLIQGRVKSIEIKLRSGQYKRVPFGKIEISSGTPIWLRYRARHEKNERAGLRTPVLLAVKADLTQENVSHALSQDDVISSLRALKLDLPGLGEQQLQILKPQVTLGDNQVNVNGTLVTAGAAPESGVQLIVTGKPTLEGDDRIVLTDIVVNSPDIVEPGKFAEFVEELLNPLVNLHRFDRPNFALRLDSLSVADQRLHAEGRLLIAPPVNSTVGMTAQPTNIASPQSK
jgi:hypothetical protein